MDPPVKPVPDVTDVTVPLQGVTHCNPEAVEVLTDRNWPLVPRPRATGVDAAEALMIDPLAVKRVGAITHAVFNAIVPVEVIVPPVKPVPAITDVTVPVLPPLPFVAEVIRP
jgi:hypothetical protein